MKRALCMIAAALALSSFGAVVVADFEDGAVPRVEEKGFFAGVTNAYATSGEHALRFRCDKWEQGMKERLSVEVKPAATDLSKFSAIAIDVVSLAGGVVDDGLGIALAGPDGRAEDAFGEKTPLPRHAHFQWVVHLPKKWKEKTPCVASIQFYSDRPQSVDVVIDRLTLLEEGEKPLAPDGPCVGRDILPLVEGSAAELSKEKSDLERRLAHVQDYLRLRNAAAASRYHSPDFALGTATSMEKVRPRSRFAASPIPDDGLRLRLARNETESLQVLVAPCRADLVNVRVDAGPMTGPRGEAFAASNIVCSVMGYVKTLKRPPYSVGLSERSDKEPGYVCRPEKPEEGWWPDPILDFMKAADVRGDDVQSFWVQVRCPADQPAGVYLGKLVVSADGVKPVAIPFAVRVNDFAVPVASPLPMAITFDPGPSWQKATAKERELNARIMADPLSPVNMWKRHRQEWHDFLADHYITLDSLYHHSGREMDFDALERLKSQGRLGRFNLGYWPQPASTNAADMAKWRESIIPNLREAYDEAKVLGLLGHAYCYGSDEIPKEQFAAVSLAVKELKAALPGVPISTTAYDNEFGVGTELSEIDWFTPLTPKFDLEKAAKSRAQGRQVWWYICCSPVGKYANMFVESAAIDARMLMGAQTVRMRPDGFLYYETTLWNCLRCIEAGPFTDWDPRSWTTYHGDGSWVCCGPDGTPLSTIRLENFRDGLEDYAYAMELERLLGEHGRDDEWAKEARRLIAVPREVMDSMTDFTGDPAAVYRWRDAMADLIESAGLQLRMAR